MRCLFASLVAASMACASGPAFGDEKADFFANKTVTMVVGSSAAGSYDLNARLLSRHMGRHIPGAPPIIVRNMPGGGGLTAAAYLYNRAVRDGTEIGALSRTLPILPLFGEAKDLFDPQKFGWIGSTVNVVGTAVSWHSAAVKTIQGAMQQELIIGGTGPGSQANVYPTAMNNLLGTRFRIVSGYPGSAEVIMAMERGEIEGFGSWSWSAIEKGGYLKESKLNILVQLGMKKHPDYPDIPLVLDLAKTPADRAALELVFAPQTFARPIAAPPNVAPERLAVLRRAFDATLADPELLSEAERLKLDIDLVTGTELETLIKRLYDSPLDVIARAKEALGGSLKAD